MPKMLDMADAEEEEKDEDDALIHEKAIGKGDFTREGSLHVVPMMQQGVSAHTWYHPICRHDKACTFWPSG